MLSLFISRYYSDIANKIEEQQVKHGLARIHSHRHISRCVIYADWYCDFLGIKDPKEKLRLYFAISLHDIGRKGELEDLWENESYQIYLDYVLYSVKVDKKIVNNNKDLIVNKFEKSTLNNIIRDVDCLDIMRSGAGKGGIIGFDKNYLILFKEQTYLQDRLISGAWQLINLSDGDEFENVNCLKIIDDNIKNSWRIKI